MNGRAKFLICVVVLMGLAGWWWTGDRSPEGQGVPLSAPASTPPPSQISDAPQLRSFVVLNRIQMDLSTGQNAPADADLLWEIDAVLGWPLAFATPSDLILTPGDTVCLERRLMGGIPVISLHAFGPCNTVGGEG